MPLLSWTQYNVVVYGRPDALLTAKIPFARLNRYVSFVIRTTNLPGDCGNYLRSATASAMSDTSSAAAGKTYAHKR